MTPNQIKSELILRGITQAGIAADLCLKSSGGVSGVIHRFWTSRRIAAEIARRIDKPVEVVFPELAKKPARRTRRR